MADDLPTEDWRLPKGLMRALRAFLDECPHGQVKHLARGLEAAQRVPEPAAEPKPEGQA